MWRTYPLGKFRHDDRRLALSGRDCLRQQRVYDQVCAGFTRPTSHTIVYLLATNSTVVHCQVFRPLSNSYLPLHDEYNTTKDRIKFFPQQNAHHPCVRMRGTNCMTHNLEETNCTVVVCVFLDWRCTNIIIIKCIITRDVYNNNSSTVVVHLLLSSPFAHTCMIICLPECKARSTDSRFSLKKQY